MKQKRTKILLLLLMASISSVIGQQDVLKRGLSNSFNYEDVYILKKVTFWEPSGLFGYQSWIQIMSDDDPNDPISGSSNTIAWENGKKVKPIAYVSNSYPRLETEFEISCSGGNASKYYARATNEDGYNFPVRELTLSNGRYRYPKTDCDKKFDDKVVRYWENFELKWEISNNANGPWIDCGSSKNYMYVTHKTPLIGLYAIGHIAPTNAQHTLLHLSCLNANSQSQPANIIDGIYVEFTDRDVKRFDSAGPIKYWGSLGSICWDVPTMLKNLDGACQGWASFFEDLIRLQGISTSEMSTVTYNQYVLSASDVSKLNEEAKTFFGSQITNLYTLQPDVQGYSGIRSDFLVKNWNIDSSSKFVMNEYANLIILPTNILLANGNTIAVASQGGEAGQGNDNPRSEFENHAITKYNGKYYDPSYGSAIATSANNWETPALDGYGSILVYNHNGTFYRINWVGHLNDASLQSSINP